MNKKFLWLGLAGLFSLSMNAQAYNIDLFEEFQDIKDTTADGFAVVDSVSDGGDGSIIGGMRDISVDLITDGSGSSFNGTSMSVAYNALYGTNALAFSNDASSGGEGIVQWDATAGIQDWTSFGGAGLGGFDLRAFGDAISVDTLEADIGYEIMVNAYTSATEWTQVTISTIGPGVRQIIFDDMENDLLCGATNIGPIVSVDCGAGGTVDFSSLVALELVINVDGGAIAVDLTIGPVTAVPEPASLGLFGLGLLGAGVAGARRRKNKA